MACVLALFLAVGSIPAGSWGWHWYRARGQWRAAEAAIARYDLEEAAAHLDSYLEDRPEEVRGWFLAARTARRLDRMAEASRRLERCQQLGGVTDSTLLEWDLQRVQGGAAGEIAVRLRKTIDPDHPDAPLVLEALAKGYLRADRLGDARQACALWVTQQPDHPWPWLWSGNVSERLQDLDKALANYERAVRNAPDDRDARLALGGLLLRRKKYDIAAEQYERVLSRFAGDDAASVGLAASRMGQGRTAEVVPVLDDLASRTPPPPKALLLRGKAALESDRTEEAEAWLREAVRQAPDDREAHYLLSQALQAQGKKDEAIRVAARVEELRKVTDRLNQLIKMIDNKPDDPRPRHESGVLALRIGRTEEGLRQLRGLLHLKGDHRETHAVLADYFRQKGDAERAEMHRSLAQTPPR